MDLKIGGPKLQQIFTAAQLLIGFAMVYQMVNVIFLHILESMNFRNYRLKTIPFIFEIFVRTFCGLWDCDACMEDVYQLSMIYSTPEAIEGWLTSLKGQKICKNPSLNLNEVEVEACINFIQEYFPLAVKSLETTIRENKREICRSWYDGVCE